MRHPLSLVMSPYLGTRQDTKSKRFTKSENEFVKAKSHMNSIVLIRHFRTRILKTCSIFQLWCFHDRGFPKIDYSGIDARIVFEQNKFQQKSHL